MHQVGYTMTGEQSENGDDESPEDARMHAAALVSARRVVCNFLSSHCVRYGSC